ncbi:hypothetical protein ACVWXN_009491 [Bradyrhizobium sp. i1.4.4]
MVASVTTRSYDRARTGANNSETVLTATAVRSRGIVKLFSLPIPDDPRLEAQPLAVGGVHTADGKTRDLILQASMGNWVYAFDAVTGEKIWATNLGRPIVGTRVIDGHMTNVHWGILSTPVIDEGASILYACAWISDDGSVAKGQHFLAALRIRDGSKVHGLLNLEGAVYTPPNGLPVQKFVSAQRKQRSALTLTRNHVLIPFGTIAETSKTARGWLLAVDVHAWRLAASWCSTVTGSGGGLWQSGAGPALAPDGSIYVITGNGAFSPQHGDFGESIVRLALHTGSHAHFEVMSWWAPWTDANRVGAAADAAAADDDNDELALPSNVSLPSVIAHARRMGMTLKPRYAREMPHVAVTSGRSATDAQIAPVVAHHMEAMNESMWGDQDFGSGGPVYVGLRPCHSGRGQGRHPLHRQCQCARQDAAGRTCGRPFRGELQQASHATDPVHVFRSRRAAGTGVTDGAERVSRRRDAASAWHAAAVPVRHPRHHAFRRRREQRLAGLVDCGRRENDLSRRGQRDRLAAIAASAGRHAWLEHHACRQQRHRWHHRGDGALSGQQHDSQSGPLPGLRRAEFRHQSGWLQTAPGDLGQRGLGPGARLHASQVQPSDRLERPHLSPDL